MTFFEYILVGMVAVVIVLAFVAARAFDRSLDE